MTTRARDVMQTHVVSVSPNDPLHSVQRLFYEEGIHGAPVVDETDRVLGFVSSTDVLRAAAEDYDIAPGSERDAEDHDFWPISPDDFRERLGDTLVSDVMTDGLVQVTPDETVPAIARTLREQSVHRVLVVDGDKLSGIVSALDLVRLLED